MLRLIWEKPRPVVHMESRLWLVFFRDDARQGSWWDWFTRPGFRHVSAAAWFDQTQRWVFFDPTFKATTLQIVEAGPDADAIFGKWVGEAGAIVRFCSRAERTTMPGLVGCVGQIKSLLGIRCGALAPSQLHRHLLAHGAEPVDVPQGEHNEPIQDPRPATGRPADQSLARA